jgi:hypothetical protein
MRDIQAVETHALGCGQQLRQCLGAKLQRFQVDQPVEISQSLCRGLLFVQRRAARGCDTGSDQAN